MSVRRPWITHRANGRECRRAPRPAEVIQGPRIGFGEIEKEIGTRPEPTQRQLCRSLTAQSWDNARLEQGAICRREAPMIMNGRPKEQPKCVESH